jgi:phosphoribosylformimino-5-aminoimidazole carboxamide ribotide isomerase
VTHSWTKTVRTLAEAMLTMPFQVIPVIDLKNGQAVHAIGGRRAHYQPIQSVLHPSSDPIAIARAYHAKLALNTIYLADLDSIDGAAPRVEVYSATIALGFHISVDCGVRDAGSVAALREFKPSSLTIVAGLESVSGPEELREVVEQLGAERVVFSLDLFDGRPRIAAPAAWGTEDPRALVRKAIACGIYHVLILDLARVGTGRGPGTQHLMMRIRQDHAAVRLIVGGGISGVDDIVALRQAGASAVLVGSALHDGRIGVRELERLQS